MELHHASENNHYVSVKCVKCVMLSAECIKCIYFESLVPGNFAQFVAKLLDVLAHLWGPDANTELGNFYPPERGLGKKNTLFSVKLEFI